MKGLFNKIFKLQDNVDYQSLLQEGAVVVDVRSKEEYMEGHIRNSLNIPLDVLIFEFFKLGTFPGININSSIFIMVNYLQLFQ